jgi:hypothetical protein
MEGGGFGFPFGGDPEEIMRGLREFAEQQAESVQEAQREQFATLTLNTAVELTAAALQQIQPQGGVDEQAIALRDAMRVLFPRRWRSSAPRARGSCARPEPRGGRPHRIAAPVTLLDHALVRLLPAVPKPVVQLFSSRYIAGATLAEAVECVRELNSGGRWPRSTCWGRRSRTRR